VDFAVEQGKTVAILEMGDPMMYGETFYLEMLPRDFPSEIVPGVGAFQAAASAVKMSPPYGWDTNAVKAQSSKGTKAQSSSIPVCLCAFVPAVSSMM
jgi:precorrin-2 methylase